MSTSLAGGPAVENRSPGRGVPALLACGIAYSVSFVAVGDVLAGRLSGGYDYLDQTMSELSARGASTRPLLAALVPIWSGLLIAFGIGVLRAANGNRPLRVVGGLLIAHAVVSVQWLWFPMTARADISPGSLRWNDIGHVALIGWSGLFALAEIGCGAAAFTWRFRVYSIVTIVTALVFGALTSTQAAHLFEGKSTPLIGVYERGSVGAWLLWIAVLSVILLQRRKGVACGPRIGRLDRSTARTEMPGSNARAEHRCQSALDT